MYTHSTEASSEISDVLGRVARLFRLRRNVRHDVAEVSLLSSSLDLAADLLGRLLIRLLRRFCLLVHVGLPDSRR